MNPLLQAWEKVLASDGDRMAILSYPESGKLTFAQVNHLGIDIYRKHLKDIEDPKSKIIAFKIKDRTLWITTFLAIQKSGAMALPIDGTYTRDEVSRVLSAMQVNAYFDEANFIHLSDRKHLGLSRACISLFKITSGSTATPKPFAFTQKQMMADAHNILSTMGISKRDLQFSTIPLGHSYGLGSLVYPFFQEGISLVFNSMPLPSIIENELRDSAATVMPTIPGILKGLVLSGDLDLPKSLRLIISAASQLDPDLAHRFFQQHGRRIHNFYGSSETGGIAYDESGELVFDKQAVGRPLNNVTVETSETGRVLVTSEAVFSFRNRRKALCHSSFLLSDYGTLHAGALLLRGRSNRMAKHNGKRIDLGQIENVLHENNAINDVFVHYDEDRHRLIAAISGSISLKEFQIYCQQKLAVWKRPKIVWFVDELPHNARGKLDKIRILNELLQKGKFLRYK